VKGQLKIVLEADMQLELIKVDSYELFGVFGHFLVPRLCWKKWGNFTGLGIIMKKV